MKTHALPTTIALALGLMLAPAKLQSQALYSENFLNTAPSGNMYLADFGWNGYAYSGAAPLSAANAYIPNLDGNPGPANGYLALSGLSGNFAMIRTFAAIDAAGSQITWSMGNSATSTSVRLLVRSNGNWYASSQLFSNATAYASQAAFSAATTSDVRRTLPFSTAAADWRSFTLTPGSAMTLGGVIGGDLASSQITGVGYYVSTTSGTTRLDSLAVTAAQETVLFYDDFSGGMTQWKRVGSSTKPTISTSSTAPLAGNVMLSAFGKVATVAYFTPVTLQSPGDYIEASFDLLYASKQSTNTTGPSLALYNSQGTRLAADHTGAADGTLPWSLTDDRGYKAYKSFETTGDLILFKNSAGFAPMRFSNYNTALNSVSTGGSIALNSPSTLSLNITVAANGTDLTVTSTYGNHSQTETLSGADVLTKTFDEIGINLWGGDYSASAMLDGVLVTTNVSTSIPPGAAELGYTRIVIDERPKLADIAPGKTGNYKWFRGAVWSPTQPPLSNFTETNGVLTILQKADGTTNSLVGAPHDFVGGAIPRLAGSEGFYIEFDVSLSSNNTDHWPAVWLMPAEHNGGNGLPLQDVYPDLFPNDSPNDERWMELDVDEGGFRPGMLGSVISWQGQWNQPGGFQPTISNSYAAGAQPLDRTQRNIFGASWDPINQRVTWWLNGVKYYTADNTVTAGCISPVAELQNFYPILGAQAHGPGKNPPTPAVPYSMYIHAVRAYMPE